MTRSEAIGFQRRTPRPSAIKTDAPYLRGLGRGFHEFLFGELAASEFAGELAFTEDENAVADHESLIKKGIVDSTGILELISFLEETFGVAVAEEEMVPANFDSIDTVTAFLTRKLPG